MVSLLGRELPPILSRSFHLLLPLRRQLIELALILRQPVSLLRTHVAQTVLHVRRWRGRRLLPVRTLRMIVPVASAVVIRARVLTSRRAVVVAAAAVRIIRLPIWTAARRLRSRSLGPRSLS